jgi:hypothetical protein
MRVRIRKSLQGIVQGVSLSHLMPGLTYDLNAALGRYLVTVGAADAVSSKHPALVIPLDTEDAFNRALGGISVTQIAEAADQRRRKRTARKKR